MRTVILVEIEHTAPLPALLVDELAARAYQMTTQKQRCEVVAKLVQMPKQDWERDE